MKKRALLTGIFSFVLIFGFIFAGCDTGTNGGNNSGTPTTGTVTIKNSSATYPVTYVEIQDVATNNDVIDETVSITVKGGSKTFTVDPGKYEVHVWDSDGFEATSTQFQLNAGGSKTLTYDGYSLY